ncbi:hypothetical protein P43SY_006156 [Pythium insidiosum]|uniref:Alpha N-terminal protein methyltransferase 1 n=1 Tax=Pythium insidiosum TaxID=114742 RepID=A0AAD5LY35_PYTIN|nr:hypothetical protein P43SY_006156 [Pythium insidiosum]
MATPSLDAATTTTSEPLLVSQEAPATSIDWDALRQVSEIVQRDLDDDDELDDVTEHSSIFAMWQQELRDVRSVDATVARQQAKWYASANDYWQDEANCPLDDNGVLGGFAHIAPADVHDSREFIIKIAMKRPQWKRETVVDCGAGIGRVTKSLLLPMFKHVDLVEQSERLLRGVPKYIRGVPPTREGEDALKRVRKLYCMGLQDFDAAPGSYDLIWIQWVSSHLMDFDFVRFLQRCKLALAPHGWIAVKENVLLAGSPYEIDRQDSSMTRSDTYFKSIFRQAGLKVIAEQRQTNFPEELYPVKMYALALQDAWALAAVELAEPKREVKKNGVTFHPQDIKALQWGFGSCASLV